MIINVSAADAIQTYWLDHKEDVMTELMLANQDSDYLVVNSDVRDKLALYSAAVGNVTRPLQIGYVPAIGDAAAYELKARILQTDLCESYILESPLRFRNTFLAKDLKRGVDPQDMPWEAKILSSLVAKANQEIYYDGLFYGVRNDVGTTPVTNFDGFFKHITDAITATTISIAKKNYYDMTGVSWSDTNTMDHLKAMYRLNLYMRGKKCIFMLPYKVYDFYCDNFKVVNGALPYNTKYEQIVLEGSEGNCMLVPYKGMQDADRVILTTEGNMHIGYDGDNMNFRVREDNNVKLTQFYMAFNFGTQIQSLENLVVNKYE